MTRGPEEGIALGRDVRRAVATAWLASLAVALASLLVPWFVGALDVDLSTVALTLAVGSALMALLSAALDRLSGPRFGAAALHVQNVAGIFLLAWVWHVAGGTRNPLPLVPFLLPVLALGALGRRRDVLGAALAAVIVVGSVAVCDSPELRWYLLQVGLPFEALFRGLPAELPGRGDPFPSATMTPAAEAVVLELFAVILLCGALASRAFSFRRLELAERLSMARDPEIRGVFQAAFRAAVVPSALVVSESAEVVDVSRSFANQMLLPSSGAGGRSLFDLLRFRDRASVEQLMRQGSGELPFVLYSVGAESRVARLQVQRVGHGGAEYLLVSLLDRDELFYLSRAFDAAAEALLLVSDETLVAFNDAASRLLGSLHFGMPVAPLLTGASPAAGAWWKDVPPSGLGIELAGRKLLARGFSLRPAGEPALHVLHLDTNPAESNA